MIADVYLRWCGAVAALDIPSCRCKALRMQVREEDQEEQGDGEEMMMVGGWWMEGTT